MGVINERQRGNIQMKSIVEIYAEMARNNPVWSDKEEKEMIVKLFKIGRDAFVNEAMKHNLGLVFSLVKKYAFNPSDDIVQLAVLALVRALEKFDPTKGYKISTWVAQPICWAIKQAQTPYSKLGNFSDEIEGFNHRYCKSMKVVSIDAPVGKDEDNGNETIGNFISSHNVDVNYGILRGFKSSSEEEKDMDAKTCIKMLVEEMHRFLGKKEMLVILGLLEGKNLSEIGIEMNLTRMRISQIAKSAYEKIRNSDVAILMKEVMSEN